MISVCRKDIFFIYQTENNGEYWIYAMDNKKQNIFNPAGFHHEKDHKSGKKKSHADTADIPGKGFCSFTDIKKGKDQQGYGY